MLFTVGTYRIAELGIDQTIPVVNGKAYAEIPARPALWSPETPKLYDVKVELAGDAITDMVGFRAIKAENGRILLNGEDLFLKGMCAHEENAKNGRSVTEKDAETMLLDAKALG